MEAWTRDASSLADAIRAGEVRSSDALEASLGGDRALEAERGRLSRRRWRARGAPPAIDRRIAAGEDPGLLAGVPILVKDLEDAAGMPTTHGSVVFKDNIATADSISTRAATRGGRGDRREVGGAGVRPRRLYGDEAARRHAQPMEPRAHAGRVVRRFCCGRLRRACADRHGHRRRRLDPRSRRRHCGLVGMKGSYGRIPRGPQRGARRRSPACSAA